MPDKYMMDSTKLPWHADRIRDWQAGKRIAPIHIDVGLGKGCNIRCVYCFGSLQGNRYQDAINTYFPREPLLRYMRDAGAVGVRSMALIGEAEPLLNPHVYEAIVEGSKAGVDIALGTNGILMNTGSPGLAALEHLRWIRFNISAATPEAYQRIHNSPDFAIAVEKIRWCVETKHKRGLPITVGLQMVLTPANVDQLVPLAKLGRELGVSYFVVKQCADTVASDLGVFDKLDQYKSYTDLLSEAESVSTPDYDVIIKWHTIMKKGAREYEQCLGVPFLLYTSGDGRVYPCGMFFDYREEEFRMGDLTTQSFADIIASDRYWEIVEKVRTSIDIHQCYASCRTDQVNEFLWGLKTGKTTLTPPDRDPPSHLNFV